MTGERTQLPPEPRLELLTRVEVELAEPLDLGQTPQGHRRIVPITGGVFNGPRLSGRIVPGGGDWQIVHEEGWIQVDARYTGRADDGTLFSIIASGVRHGPLEVMARLLAGESPDPATYRFQTAIRFETSDGPLAWLNHIVAVGSAVRRPATVVQDIYEVL